MHYSSKFSNPRRGLWEPLVFSQVRGNVRITQEPVTCEWHRMWEQSPALSLTCGIWANSGRTELTCRTPNWCGRISCYRKEPTRLVTELFCVISEFFLKQFPKCNLKAQKQLWINAHYLLSGLHLCLLRDLTSHSIKITCPRECLKEPQCWLRKACSYEIVVDWSFASTFICWSPNTPTWLYLETRPLGGN